MATLQFQRSPQHEALPAPASVPKGPPEPRTGLKSAPFRLYINDRDIPILPPAPCPLQSYPAGFIP